MIPRFTLLIPLLLFALLGGGCTTVRVTDPPRTATEQFLLSVAAGAAAEQVSGDGLRGRTVYIDPTYLTSETPSSYLTDDDADGYRSPEQNYMLAEMRAQLLLAGTRLVQERDEAEIVVEVRSGGIGIDRYEFLFGIPSIPISSATAAAGIPTGGGASTPELALLKNLRQLGAASIAYTAYWRDTGELIANSGPFVGRSEREDWWFFGWGPHSISNIPTTQPLE